METRLKHSLKTIDEPPASKVLDLVEHTVPFLPGRGSPSKTLQPVVTATTATTTTIDTGADAGQPLEPDAAVIVIGVVPPQQEGASKISEFEQFDIGQNRFATAFIQRSTPPKQLHPPYCTPISNSSNMEEDEPPPLQRAPASLPHGETEQFADAEGDEDVNSAEVTQSPPMAPATGLQPQEPLRDEEIEMVQDRFHQHHHEGRSDESTPMEPGASLPGSSRVPSIDHDALDALLALNKNGVGPDGTPALATEGIIPELPADIPFSDVTQQQPYKDTPGVGTTDNGQYENNNEPTIVTMTTSKSSSQKLLAPVSQKSPDTILEYEEDVSSHDRHAIASASMYNGAGNIRSTNHGSTIVESSQNAIHPSQERATGTDDPTLQADSEIQGKEASQEKGTESDNENPTAAASNGQSKARTGNVKVKRQPKKAPKKVPPSKARVTKDVPSSLLLGKGTGTERRRAASQRASEQIKFQVYHDLESDHEEDEEEEVDQSQANKRRRTVARPSRYGAPEPSDEREMSDESVSIPENGAATSNSQQQQQGSKTSHARGKGLPLARGKAKRSKPKIPNGTVRSPSKKRASESMPTELAHAPFAEESEAPPAEESEAPPAEESEAPPAEESEAPLVMNMLETCCIAPGQQREDPNPCYVEETAWKFHNPSEEDIPAELLRPVPPPPPLPDFPQTGHCTWTFDEESRVLYADFRRPNGEVVLHYEDEKFLLCMMERDDVSLITEGLVTELDEERWNLQYLSKAAGGDVYHGFRHFQYAELKPARRTGKQKAPSEKQENVKQFREKDGFLSMKVSDYVRYLEARQAALEPDSQADTKFSFESSDGTQLTIDVRLDVLYMIDYDMVKLVPKMYQDFVESFKLPGIMPGGEHCMLDAVNTNGRPFMGPNMYVTPPGAFTHLHQDGHGTVDSGHFCVSGCNEVVMLRRLTERHKSNALALLKANANYNVLYELPHGDGLGEKPMWPSTASIEKCKEMGYCPSVFVLRPGQLLHINKGRIHAFRKQTSEVLPVADCHAELRAMRPPSEEVLCVSVAWDWQFRGVTSEGINREIAASLECAAYNRARKKRSLAIPETSLLQMVKTMPPAKVTPVMQKSSFLRSMSRSAPPEQHPQRFRPSRQTILKGILPSLRFIVEQHAKLEEQARSFSKKNRSHTGPRIILNKGAKPNSSQNPEVVTVEPYGNDFFCRLCHCELSNLYFHCEGCEKILLKDFNICGTCFEKRSFAERIRMHPLISSKAALNHLGKPFHPPRICKGCPCKQGPACGNCKWCPCSCQCHQWFAVNYRFFTIEDEVELLRIVENEVGEAPCQYAEETKQRLQLLSQYHVPTAVHPQVTQRSNVRAASISGEAEDAEEKSRLVDIDKSRAQIEVDASTPSLDDAAVPQPCKEGFAETDEKMPTPQKHTVLPLQDKPSQDECVTSSKDDEARKAAVVIGVTDDPPHDKAPPEQPSASLSEGGDEVGRAGAESISQVNNHKSHSSRDHTCEERSDVRLSHADEEGGDNGSTVINGHRTRQKRSTGSSVSTGDDKAAASEETPTHRTTRRARASYASKQHDAGHETGDASMSPQASIQTLKLVVTVGRKPVKKHTAEALVCSQDLKKKKSKMKCIFDGSKTKRQTKNVEDGLHESPSRPKKARRVGQDAYLVGTSGEQDGLHESPSIPKKSRRVEQSPGLQNGASNMVGTSGEEENQEMDYPMKAKNNGNSRKRNRSRVPPASESNANLPTQREACGANHAAADTVGELEIRVASLEPDESETHHFYEGVPGAGGSSQHRHGFTPSPCVGLTTTVAGDMIREPERGLSGETLTPAEPKNLQGVSGGDGNSHRHDIFTNPSVESYGGLMGGSLTCAEPKLLQSDLGTAEAPATGHKRKRSLDPTFDDKDAFNCQKVSCRNAHRTVTVDDIVGVSTVGVFGEAFSESAGREVDLVIDGVSIGDGLASSKAPSIYTEANHNLVPPPVTACDANDNDRLASGDREVAGMNGEGRETQDCEGNSKAIDSEQNLFFRLEHPLEIGRTRRRSPDIVDTEPDETTSGDGHQEGVRMNDRLENWGGGTTNHVAVQAVDPKRANDDHGHVNWAVADTECTAPGIDLEI